MRQSDLEILLHEGEGSMLEYKEALSSSLANLIEAVDRIVLFGSVVRGEDDEESDVDLLVVLKGPPEHKIRNRISRIILEINLEHDTNLSSIVVEQQAWDEGLLSVSPIHEEIEEEGIPL